MQNKWLRDRKSPSITCELYDFGRHLTCVQGAPSPIFFWGTTTWELFTVTLGALCIADLGNKGEWSLSRSGCYVLFGEGWDALWEKIRTSGSGTFLPCENKTRVPSLAQLFNFLLINITNFRASLYPVSAVSRLASRGEQWLHYVIYIQIAPKQD